MREKRINFLARYLRARLGVIFLTVTLFIVNTLVLLLYNVSAEIIRYAFLLCASTVGVFAVIDFLGFVRRECQFEATRNTLDFTIDEVPPPLTYAEKEYVEILELLDEERREQRDIMERTYSEQVEYYTAWVHQIKTPIAALRLILNERGESNGEAAEELFKIEQYVSMVLTYLRLDSPSSDLVVRNCDVEKIARQEVRKYAGMFVRRRLALQFDDFSYTALTDEKWLSFVIGQVLSNALKYTSQGSIRIYFGPQSKTLCISDTGMGIAAEDLPRIFEKGYTGYNGRVGKQSSGLGLYLCKQMCDKLGHTLTVESAVGEGTTVKIGLRRIELEIE